MFTKKVWLACCLSAGLTCVASNATTIDLTEFGSSAVINGALLMTSDLNTGAGSGAIQSFLRTRANGFERGYNTDGAFEFDQVPGCCTHSLLLGDLDRVTIDGLQYVQFRLDINEPASGNKSGLTMHGLELWVNTSTGSDTNYSDGLGDLVWSLDALLDNQVELENNLGTNGSGDFDYAVYIPFALFAGYADDDFIYLYNEFGNPGQASEAGFEEWVAVVETAVIPVPGAVWLLASGLFGLAGLKRRKRAA